MKLTLDIIDIKNIQLGEKTYIEGGTLFINSDELKDLISADKRISKVNIDLVHPDEMCRVVQIIDIVEPRTKLEGENFPGILGNLKTAGDGHTLVLRGASVISTDNTGRLKAGIFDMSGPAAKYNIYSHLHHVILQCQPAEGISEMEYYKALRTANLNAAIYLAEVGKGLPVDKAEIYELPSLIEMNEYNNNLPRIAYIYQIHTLQQSTEYGQPIFYGDDVMRLLPTIVHPNEILDGALICGYSRGQETYSIQNHPIIKELYNRHGKDLYFVGVVVVIAAATTLHRQISAMMAPKLAKSILGANGVVLTKTGGGAPHADMGWTAETCEDLGMKTVMVVHEQSGDMTSGESLLYWSENVDAVVNIGSWNKVVQLPPMPKVIGGTTSFKEKQANEDIEVIMHTLFGALNQVGASKLMVQEI
jgi:sarcosine reductase